jgi:hypothetical protein
MSIDSKIGATFNLQDDVNYVYDGVIEWHDKLNKSDVFSVKYVAFNSKQEQVSKGIIQDEPSFEKLLSDDNALVSIVKELYSGKAMSLVNVTDIQSCKTKISTPPMSRNHSRSVIATYLINAMSELPHKSDEELEILKKDPKYKLFHKVLADMGCKQRERECGAIYEIFIDEFGEKAFDYERYKKYVKNNVYEKHHGQSYTKEPLI